MDACVLRHPSQAPDDRDLVGDSPFEVGNIVGKPSQFFVLIRNSAIRLEGGQTQSRHERHYKDLRSSMSMGSLPSNPLR